MSTSTRETVTIADVNKGDTLHFLGTAYVVDAISTATDGLRSIVFADTSQTFHYEVDTQVERDVAPAAPARPLIDFSLARYATAREYASAHVSRVNKPETNTRLRNVADGQKVDAYDLNEALTDAMRGAATRKGQSPGRRRDGKEIAHLAHIVQAVLNSHADGLPAYAEGDRSRAVEDAKEGLALAMAEVERLTAALEAEKLRGDQMCAQFVDADEDRRAADRQVSILSSVIGYTRGLGTEAQAARSLGYQHGLEGR